MKQSTGLSKIGRFLGLCVMMVLLVVPAASAGTFDAAGIGSKELSKAERLAGQFAKQVDQADQFVQKNNLSMAGKRLANAERAYNKIIAPYRLHPEVMINKARFDELQAKVIEAKAGADLEKNIKAYDKKVTEAQKYLDRKDTKNCERFLGKALTAYEAIPEAHRSRADVQDTKARYDAIVAKTGASVKAKTAVAAKASVDSGETYGLDKKALRKAKSYASRFDKKMVEANRFFQEKDFYTCERRLKDAKKLYVKIGPEYQQNPGVQETKKTFDEMYAIVTKAVADRKASIEKKSEMLLTQSSFSGYVRNHERMLAYLQKGRDGKRVNSLDSLESFIKNFEVLDKFHATLQDKYTVLLEENPDREVEDETVKTIFDLAEKRVAYRDALVKKTMNDDLDHQIAFLTKENAALLETNKARSALLNDLDRKDYGENFHCVKNVRAFSKTTGLPVPTEKIETIKAFQGTFQKSLKSVRRKLKFKKSDYPYQTSAMKRVAANTAKAQGKKLIYVGMAADQWSVNKNDLGIPLSKAATGRGLYHVAGEDFYRGYDVLIIRQFNGSGYEPVSIARPDSKATIYKK